MNNFPKTRNRATKIEGVPILEELRKQTVYLKNVNRLVNFIWAGLLAVAALGIAYIVFLVLIASVGR